MVLRCKYIGEFSPGSSRCSDLAPGRVRATADVRAGADREGRADGTHGGRSARLVRVADCETLGSGLCLGQAAGSAPAPWALSSSYHALAVLCAPFAQHGVNCFFLKIMGTCPPHVFKFWLPRLGEWMPLLSLFSLLLDWLLSQSWRITLFASNAFSLPLLILSTVTCQVLYQHTRNLFSCSFRFLERERSEH